MATETIDWKLKHNDLLIAYEILRKDNKRLVKKLKEYENEVEEEEDDDDYIYYSIPFCLKDKFKNDCKGVFDTTRTIWKCSIQNKNKKYNDYEIIYFKIPFTFKDDFKRDCKGKFDFTLKKWYCIKKDFMNSYECYKYDPDECE